MLSLFVTGYASADIVFFTNYTHYRPTVPTERIGRVGCHSLLLLPPFSRAMYYVTVTQFHFTKHSLIRLQYNHGPQSVYRMACLCVNWTITTFCINPI